VPENVTVTGLLPGTSYHYRIVASSVAGTSYGKDEVFETKVLSTPSVLQQSNGNQEIYYRSNNGILNWWLWNTAKGTWTHEWLGNGDAMAGDPRPIEQSSGNKEIYYIGTNGLVSWWFWNLSAGMWSLLWLES
jgi:hypothetical protein